MSHYVSSGICQLLPSMLAFDPSTFGLPPFGDVIHGVTPMDTPIHIRGTVVKGFGRGSKVGTVLVPIYVVVIRYAKHAGSNGVI